MTSEMWDRSVSLGQWPLMVLCTAQQARKQWWWRGAHTPGLMDVWGVAGFPRPDYDLAAHLCLSATGNFTVPEFVG